MSSIKQINSVKKRPSISEPRSKFELDYNSIIANVEPGALGRSKYIALAFEKLSSEQPVHNHLVP